MDEETQGNTMPSWGTDHLILKSLSLMPRGQLSPSIQEHDIEPRDSISDEEDSQAEQDHKSRDLYTDQARPLSFPETGLQYNKVSATLEMDSKPDTNLEAGVEKEDIGTREVFYTATPGYPSNYETPGRLDPSTPYGKAISEERLLVAKEVEVNWSGRGQHVEFQAGESVPLEVQQPLGHSSTALVEKVRCRRIQLARKSIQCRRGVALDRLVQEVAYLHRLRHPHLVQLVGSYLQGTTFAILLYPAATTNLEEYMLKFEDPHEKLLKRALPLRESGLGIGSQPIQALECLSLFLCCLAHTVQYMHGEGVRHMDIKPSNILINETLDIGGRIRRSIYLTDFGISSSFTLDEGSETEGPRSMTRKWCSPEVAAQQPRGRASDIFSLGCVFVQMCTVMMQWRLYTFDEFRGQDGNGEAFYMTLPRVQQWIDMLRAEASQEDGIHIYRRDIPPLEVWDLLKEMIEEDPKNRPHSDDVIVRLTAMRQGVGFRHLWGRRAWECCSREPEPFKVAEEDEIHDAFSQMNQL